MNEGCERCVALTAKVAALKERIDAAQEAVRVATTSLDKRLDGMNEFRKTIEDQADKLVSKELYTTEHNVLRKQIDINTLRLNEIEKIIASENRIKQDKKEGFSAIYFIVAMAGIFFSTAVSVVTVVWNFFTYTGRH